MAQQVENPPVMRETWVRPLDWEDPLEKGKGLPIPMFWPEEFHGLYMGKDELKSMAQVIYKMKRGSSQYPFLLLTIQCLFVF